MREEDIRPQALFGRFLDLCVDDIRDFFADAGSFVPVACPGCGGNEQTSGGFTKHGFTYVVCASCGSLFVQPRPTPAMLARYYAEGRGPQYWSSDFYRQTEASRRARIMAPRAHLLRELLAAGGFSQQPSVVDIGAGFGVFLEEVRSSGVCDRLLAIEPNPALATVCRTKGIEVVEKSLESVEEGEVSASMATCFEVLEHVFDPLAFLRGARRALRPGGEMLLTTLTSSGFDIQVLWEHSDSVFPPHHINLLSLEGVRRLAERAGLEVVDISTPGELDVDIVRNKLAQHSELAVPRFIRRLVTESSEVIVGRFQQFLKDASLSSHLRIVLRRTAST